MNWLQRFLYARSSDLAREVVDLLVGDPKGWQTVDGYWLRHDRAKLEVWIANEAYALKVRVWPLKRGFPADVNPGGAGRRLIWSIVRARREPTPEQIQSARATEALRHRRAV